MTPAEPVGRERELGVLRAAVSALTARKPAVVSVLGPPGSGRNTLFLLRFGIFYPGWFDRR